MKTFLIVLCCALLSCQKQSHIPTETTYVPPTDRELKIVARKGNIITVKIHGPVDPNLYDHAGQLK